MNITDRIQSLRKAEGIPQEELTDKTGVSRQAVSKWGSEQNVPDLDKIIIMSEYFDVTTNYIPRGIEPAVNDQEAYAVLTSKILCIASTAFLAIGLFCAFGSWYEQQVAGIIWGSMIIQAAGVAGYFVGTLLSGAKASFAINWLGILLAVFTPLSLIVAVCFRSIAAPYPAEITTDVVFTVVCLITVGLNFVILKREAKKE